MEHSARIRKALVPLGLACGDILFLAQGANNAVYTFEAGGRSLVAKLGVNPASRNLDREWAFLQAHPGVGPEGLVYAVDEQGSQLIVQERLAGRHPFALDADGLEALGRLVRGYHALAAPAGTPGEDWRSFVADRILPIPTDCAHPALARDLAKCLGEAVARGSTEVAPTIGSSVLVHGDLIPLNLIEQSPGRYRVIDWEGLRLDESEADVATLFKAYRCEEAEQAAFLKGYGPGLRPERLRFRRLLHDLQVAAWRLACQIPAAHGTVLEMALAETREELAWARQALDGGPGLV